MKAFRVQPVGSPASKYGAYAYDGGGQRVLKVSIQGSVPHSTVYIDGIFEHHRIHLEGEEVEENNDLHVMDDASRVAIHRIGPDIFETEKPALQYQLGDHLGSSNVVVDHAGGLINREEYRPYGESSFGSFAKKRYRFTGKERDEESGLYYHGARYYAPWLCRWTAPDPAGMVDGPNLYAYVRGNPVRLVDPSGLDSREWYLQFPGQQTSDHIPQQDRTAFNLRGGIPRELSLHQSVTLPRVYVEAIRELAKDTASYIETPRAGPKGMVVDRVEFDMERAAILEKKGLRAMSIEDSIRWSNPRTPSGRERARFLERNSPTLSTMLGRLNSPPNPSSILMTVHTHPRYPEGAPAPSLGDYLVAIEHSPTPHAVATLDSSDRLTMYIFAPTERSSQLINEMSTAYNEIMDTFYATYGRSRDVPSKDENLEAHNQYWETRAYYRQKASYAAARAGEIKLYRWTEDRSASREDSANFIRIE